MQKGERLLPRSRRAEAGVERMRVQGENSMCSPCRHFRRKKMGGGFAALKEMGLLGRFCLGRFLSAFGCWLRCLLRLLLRSKLLPQFRSDGLGVHLVGRGGLLEDGAWIAMRGGQQDASLHKQP